MLHPGNDKRNDNNVDTSLCFIKLNALFIVDIFIHTLLTKAGVGHRSYQSFLIFADNHDALLSGMLWWLQDYISHLVLSSVRLRW